jgi:hypothetical protein
MYAAASGHGKVGIPQAAAKRFIAHSHGESAKDLPQHVRRMRKDVGKQLVKREG